MCDKQPVVIELNMKKIARDNMILTVVLVVLLVGLNAIIHQRFTGEFTLLDFFYFFAAYILLIILHEAFHLIGFMLFGGVPYKELDYGINLQLGVAYATTKKPLTNAAMKKALLLPFWTTGIVPTVIGLMLDNFLIVIIGALLIAGAMGDFYMYKELRKYPNEATVRDDSKEPKLYVYL
ncbi:DUF3267 domain-containing protein [Solibacillus merdavium]|uniref:DUF3267 domain-containing protein n=1 Tax=Solibacillus merdavium TaxID=2762218 RepID=A0ABR8XNY1_9BACL|nr:DUF3267 domain-containing protein [Solibacillus merdavium]MBD8033649.1 DUF3267 domain-containing protein [Solibacillus merdavium]